MYDKPSTDGSSKLNIRPQTGAVTHGVLYDIAESDRRALDAAEPRYQPVRVNANGVHALSYSYQAEASTALPYDWYVAMALAGAHRHGVPHARLDVPVAPDPFAGGIRPAGTGDLGAMQSVLSSVLHNPGDRYHPHPGELAWWMFHGDPRFPGRLTWWMQSETGVLVVDEISPEINLFTRPGVDRIPLLEWARQRRLRGSGEVGWISDGDTEMVEYLRGEGYGAVRAHRSYEWDLATVPVPDPVLPKGWELRAVGGEEEADSRRQASHAAFQSTMDSGAHLERYLRFMRSPAYVPERDLVAVSPGGRVAAFMVWWPDASGIAQIEPFGTHPEFQRLGVGRALVYHGLEQMRRAGMHTARVVTDEPREAIDLYEAVGFEDVGRVCWWRKE